MHRTISTTLAAITTLLLAAPAFAIPPPPPTPAPPGVALYPLEDLTRTPPPELAARMMADVTGQFVEYRPNEQRFYGPAIPAGPLGLCQARIMTAQIQPDGADPRYYVSDLHLGWRFRQMAPGTACADIPKGAAYFDAPDVVVAYRGLALWSQVRADLLSGQRRLDWTLGCSKAAPRCDVRDVRAKALMFGDEDILAIQMVSISPFETGRPSTYRILLRNSGAAEAFTLVTRFEGYRPDGLAQPVETLKSVRLGF
ncbi:hypothetical protein [Caulobacter mirabilis]|uniref:Uncharacterized protein n=1 Tax=Caulobacter mirabilis TaxID=69666 RepID=A0A2D2ASS6_9CAUL|nr:hypothetical protein [Caulobacter mirabilis]ATQ41027.1 hypothetical protein CSW64_00700 [Caulobacter mirabilis]